MNTAGVAELVIVLTITFLLHAPLADNPLKYFATVIYECVWFALGHVTQAQYIHQVLKIFRVECSDIAYIRLDAIAVVE